jgi:hypothetical protein
MANRSNATINQTLNYLLSEIQNIPSGPTGATGPQGNTGATGPTGTQTLAQTLILGNSAGISDINMSSHSITSILSEKFSGGIDISDGATDAQILSNNSGQLTLQCSNDLKLNVNNASIVELTPSTLTLTGKTVNMNSTNGNPMTLTSDDILYLNSFNNTQINAVSSFTATAGDNIILTATNDAMSLTADDDITISSNAMGVKIYGGSGDAGNNDIVLTTQNSTLQGQISLQSGGDVLLNATSGGIVSITSADNTQINCGENFAVQTNPSTGIINLTSTSCSFKDGINSSEILLDMRTNIDQVPRITLGYSGLQAIIYKDNNLNIYSDQETIIQTAKRMTIQSDNDNTSLYNPSGSVYVDKNPFSGDGDIYAANFYGNASSASFASSSSFATTAGSATFAGQAGLVSTTGIASGGGAYNIPFVTSATSVSNATIYTDSNSHLQFNPTTNQLLADGKIISNSGFTMNGSASQLLINNNSAVTPAISAPNALLINFPNATITGSIFSGSLLGNSSTSTTSTTATNATNVTLVSASSGLYYLTLSPSLSGNVPINIGGPLLTYNNTTNTLFSTNFSGNLTGTASNASNASSATNSVNSQNVGVTSDNTSGTYYIPFTKSSGTGNKPLFQDDTTGPLSYNPSTSTLTASVFSGSCTTTGLVFLQTLTGTITGAVLATTFTLPSIFNTTYKNYRIHFTFGENSFTSYPSVSLNGYSGANVPTSADIYGYDMTSGTLSAVSLANQTLSTTPVQLSGACLPNCQLEFDVFNVGYTTINANNIIRIVCNSTYNNPGVKGIRNITATTNQNSSSTVTGLSLQSIMGLGNNPTWTAKIYGYK